MSKGEQASGAGDDGSLSVRWLADMCGLPAISNLPRLASAMIAQEEHAGKVVAHIGWWARHSDADSHFARSVGVLPEIADAELVAELSRKGYDGLLYAN